MKKLSRGIFIFIMMLQFLTSAVFCGCGGNAVEEDSKEVVSNVNESSTENDEANCTVWRDPHCFQALETEHAVFYKDEVKIEGDRWETKGLYMRDKSSGEDTLVCSDCHSCPNYYDGCVYYINKGKNIARVDLSTMKTEVIIQSEQSIEDAIVIGDWLYYCYSDGDESLFGYQLQEGITKKLMDHINSTYLMNDGLKLIVIEYDTGIIHSFLNGEEIDNSLEAGTHYLFFFYNGDRLIYDDPTGQLYLIKKGSEERKRIADAKNMVMAMSNRTDASVIELDDGGFFRVYIYNPEQESYTYAGSPDYQPRLFLMDGTMICFRDDLAMEVQLFNTMTKERSMYAIH